jgi:hypothetical protein
MTRSLTRRGVAAVLAASALAAGGCGADDDRPSAAPAGPAPTAAELLTGAVRASEGTRSAAFKVDLSVKGRASDPQVQQFLGRPLGVTLTGAAAKGALTLKGHARWMGRKDRFAVRADAARSFIQYAGTWYGPDEGLETADRRSGKRDTAEALRVLRSHGNRLVRGTVKAGPDIDGPTWQLSGTLNPDGIVAAARAAGEPMAAQEQTGLRAVAPLVRVTVAAGRADKRLRRVAVRLDLNEAQVKRLQALSRDGDQLPLQALSVRMSVDITKWNQPVRVVAPRDPQPMEALGGALFGALLGSAAAGG